TGLTALTVNSIGKLGTSTQAAGGDLISVIQGALNSLSVGSDIVGASISVKGGPNGTIGTIGVGGSILGGGGQETGEIIATGAIGPVQVGKDVLGGAGFLSGRVVTSSTLGDVTIGGGLLGGSGIGS